MSETTTDVKYLVLARHRYTSNEDSVNSYLKGLYCVGGKYFYFNEIYVEDVTKCLCYSMPKDLPVGKSYMDFVLVPVSRVEVYDGAGSYPGALPEGKIKNLWRGLAVHNSLERVAGCEDRRELNLAKAAALSRFIEVRDSQGEILDYLVGAAESPLELFKRICEGSPRTDSKIQEIYVAAFMYLTRVMCGNNPALYVDLIGFFKATLKVEKARYQVLVVGPRNGLTQIFLETFDAIIGNHSAHWREVSDSDILCCRSCSDQKKLGEAMERAKSTRAKTILCCSHEVGELPDYALALPKLAPGAEKYEEAFNYLLLHREVAIIAIYYYVMAI